MVTLIMMMVVFGKAVRVLGAERGLSGQTRRSPSTAPVQNWKLEKTKTCSLARYMDTIELNKCKLEQLSPVTRQSGAQESKSEFELSTSLVLPMPDYAYPLFVTMM